jgi:hypothetical protein
MFSYPVLTTTTTTTNAEKLGAKNAAWFFVSKSRILESPLRTLK